MNKLVESIGILNQALELGPTFFVAFLIGMLLGKYYLKSVYLSLATGACFGFVAIFLFP